MLPINGVSLLRTTRNNHDCEVANKLLEAGIQLAPVWNGQSSALKYEGCQDNSKTILQKIPEANMSWDATMDIGDEIYFNVHPELPGHVVVINWGRHQWFQYSLNKEGLNIFQQYHNGTKIVGFVAVTPYPHPFLFMTDFRIYFMKTLRTTTQEGCRLNEHCQSVPDIFTLILGKVSDLYQSFDFYRPVMESLEEIPNERTVWMNGRPLLRT